MGEPERSSSLCASPVSITPLKWFNLSPRHHFYQSDTQFARLFSFYTHIIRHSHSRQILYTMSFTFSQSHIQTVMKPIEGASAYKCPDKNRHAGILMEEKFFVNEANDKTNSFQRKNFLILVHQGQIVWSSVWQLRLPGLSNYVYVHITVHAKN